MDLVQSAVLYAVMTLVSTYLVAFAYKNVKFVLKHKYEPPFVFSIPAFLRRPVNPGARPGSLYSKGLFVVTSCSIGGLFLFCLFPESLRNAKTPSPRK